jgi:hypothetical protein
LRHRTGLRTDVSGKSAWNHISSKVIVLSIKMIIVIKMLKHRHK